MHDGKTCVHRQTTPADTGDTLSSTTDTVATDVPSGTPGDDDAPSDGAKNSAGQWGSGQSTDS